MTQLTSFHNDQTIKGQLIANLKAHQLADEFIQGTYWKDGKGCAVGCSIVDFGGATDDHREYEHLFGISQAIARLEDGIFEGLSVDDSKWWPLAFAEAVPVGKDLSMVVPKFLVWLLGDVIQYAGEDSKKAIQAVIDLHERKITGDEINVEDWRSARKAAAAYAAAAYANAANAAAYAADAADAAYANAADAADADAADAADAANAANAANAAANAAAYDNAANAAAYAAAYAYADAANAANAAAYAAANAANAAAYAAALRQSRKKQAFKLIEILKAA